MKPRLLGISPFEPVRLLVEVAARPAMVPILFDRGREAIEATRKQTLSMIVIDALQVDAEVSSLCKYLQIVHPEARMVVLSDQHGPHAGYDHLRLHRCLQRPWTVDGLREAIMAPAAIKARVSSRLLVWDLQTRKLLIADRQIALTPREARLFDHLYRNEDRSVPAEELAEAIDLPVQNERIRLTAMIVSLRKKMGDHAVWIETDRHLGYRFSRQSVVIAR